MATTFLKIEEKTALRLDRALTNLSKDGADVRKPLLRFDAEWKAITRIEANKALATGGAFRGETWVRMKPQYTRKTDGVEVPAWGGVRRVRRGWKKSTKGPGRGKSIGQRMKKINGTVSGRRRPSGARVKITSIMNRDTGVLMNSLSASKPMIIGKTLIIGGDLPEYAGRVLGDYGRNPVQFFPGDDKGFQNAVTEWLDSLAQDFNK